MFQVPGNVSEWRKVAEGFLTRYDFPNVLGCIDGKHIRIQCPEDSGSQFLNYKNYFSIVLMAVVDSNANFLYIDVGSNSRNSDGGVWNECSLRAAIDSDSLDIPAAANLPGDSENMPFVFLADEAFPLRPYLLKPYPCRALTPEKQRFNYRLSRARQVVERAFGLLAQKFRIFRGTIWLAPEKCDSIVKATCVLHNWINTFSVNGPCEESSPFLSLAPSRQTFCTRTAVGIRNKFCAFFSSR